MAAPTPTPNYVSISAFTDETGEDWLKLEGLLQASITVERKLHAQNHLARYLHLHLYGKQLNFYSNVDEGKQKDLKQALEQLRNRHAWPELH